MMNLEEKITPMSDKIKQQVIALANTAKTIGVTNLAWEEDIVTERGIHHLAKVSICEFKDFWEATYIDADIKYLQQFRINFENNDLIFTYEEDQSE